VVTTYCKPAKSPLSVEFQVPGKYTEYIDMNCLLRNGYSFGLWLWFLFYSSLPANDVLHLADSLYINHRYSEALRHYQNIQGNDHYLRQNFELNFKMAVCYLRNDEMDSARFMFKNLQRTTRVLNEYIDYFLFLIAVKQENTIQAERYSSDFLNRYTGHFLSDSVLFHLADFEFLHGKYSRAVEHYSILQNRKSYASYKPFFQSRIARSKLFLGEEENSRERMYQIMKLYPESPEALDIATSFENADLLTDKLFFTIADVYLQNRQYAALTKKLERYIIRTADPQLKEKARFYLIQIYFERGQYQTALYGFKNMLDGLRNKALEPKVNLMLARCYLFLGKKENAAEKYVEYARHFPRRRIAAESIWKACWIYEDLGKLEMARILYTDLTRQWPRSDFAWDARFRMGLIHYRHNRYEMAVSAFEAMVANRESIFQQHRGRYWLAKTYQKWGRQDQADSLFISLGKELFDSYYAVKSYFEYRPYIDPVLGLPHKLSTPVNPLKSYSESLNLWLKDFEKVFIIREVLGDDFALQEISENYHQPGSLKEWVALAEMYKRFGAFNRSFRIYDFINQKYYNKVEFLDKPFILKEFYPLYYDQLLNEYCTKRQLDLNLVLALIREESAYDRQVRSYANAYGLMQIIPETAAEIAADLGVTYSKPETLFNAELNINFGTYYLRKLLNYFDNTLEYALAAYNAGPHRVNRWKKVDYGEEMDIFIENIEFQQTRNYVRRVMKNYMIYSVLNEVKY
jgi:soluble lytic murein transglycosylase